MKILRLTRHAADETQQTALKRAFGEDVIIIDHSETVPDAARVRELIAQYQPDVLEAVLPISILAEVLKANSGIKIPVIRAVMQRELSVEGTATFIFGHYERVLKVEVITEPLRGIIDNAS